MYTTNGGTEPVYQKRVYTTSSLSLSAYVWNSVIQRACIPGEREGYAIPLWVIVVNKLLVIVAPFSSFYFFLFFLPVLSPLVSYLPFIPNFCPYTCSLFPLPPTLCCFLSFILLFMSLYSRSFSWQKRINRAFETMFETGVDEMSWDDTVRNQHWCVNFPTLYSQKEKRPINVRASNWFGYTWN